MVYAAHTIALHSHKITTCYFPMTLLILKLSHYLATNVAHTPCRSAAVGAAYLLARCLNSILSIFLFYFLHFFRSHILFDSAYERIEWNYCVCVCVCTYFVLAFGILYSCTARSCNCALLRSTACVEMSATQAHMHNLITATYKLYTCGGMLLTTTAFSDFVFVLFAPFLLWNSIHFCVISRNWTAVSATARTIVLVVVVVVNVWLLLPASNGRHVVPDLNCCCYKILFNCYVACTIWCVFWFVNPSMIWTLFISVFFKQASNSWENRGSFLQYEAIIMGN